MKSLEYHIKFDTVSAHGKRAYTHLIETFASVKYAQTVRKPSDETMLKSKYHLANAEEGQAQITKSKINLTIDGFTIIFDLDDTLTHISQNSKGADAFLPVTNSDGNKVVLGVFYRPFLKDSIEKLKKAGCEIGVWASGQSEYSNKIISFIDKDHELFDLRLFRDQCYISPKGLYLKDLRMLNRNLSKVIIVDDQAYAFGFQFDNGVLILPYKGESSDTELLTLTEYLISLMRLDDFRPTNRKHFKYAAFEKETTVDGVVKRILK